MYKRKHQTKKQRSSLALLLIPLSIALLAPLTRHISKQLHIKQCANYQYQAINYPLFQYSNQLAEQCDMTPLKLQAIIKDQGEVIYNPHTLSFHIDKY